MNKYLLVFSFSCLSFCCFSQTKIELSEVSKHVGDSVTVYGQVYNVKTFPDKSDAPTLVNMGADFPDQLLTVAVFSTYKTTIPLENSKGNIAVVTGKIEMYKGKPEIVVRSSSQLSILYKDEEKRVKQ